MKNLVKITEQNGMQAVSARDLHKRLNTEDHFTQWAKRMFEYGFIESVDYEAVHGFVSHKNGIGGTNKIDYILTMDTAKEISMLQRTEIGREIRQHFIEKEKELRNLKPVIQKPRTHLEVIQSEMALLMENERLQLDNDRMKPRDEFVDLVFNSDELLGIGEVAKLLGLPYGRNTLFSVLKEKGIFFKHKNEPLQQYINKGYFKMKESIHPVNNSKSILTVQTFATQKGLGFIAKTLNLVKIPSNQALLN
jgi:anti-repressor protein